MLASLLAARFIAKHEDNIVHLCKLDERVLFIHDGYTVAFATYDDREVLYFGVEKEPFEELSSVVKFAVCDQLRKKFWGKHFYMKCVEVSYYVAMPKQSLLDEARVKISDMIHAALKNPYLKDIVS